MSDPIRIIPFEAAHFADVMKLGNEVHGPTTTCVWILSPKCIR